MPGTTIVIIEDDPDIRVLIRANPERQGYTIHGVETDETLELYYHRKDGYAPTSVFRSQRDARIEGGTPVLVKIDGVFEGLSAVVSEENHHGVIPATTISGGGDNSPHAYSLEPYYLNPFNPSTQISFSLQWELTVELTVFNVLGQRVNTLVNSEPEAGVHTVI